jgi:excisionase family DNA binding protein
MNTSVTEVHPAGRKERLLTPKEIADELGLSAASVYRKIRRGELPALRLGRKGAALRVPENEYRRWLYDVEPER